MTSEGPWIGSVCVGEKEGVGVHGLGQCGVRGRGQWGGPWTGAYSHTMLLYVAATAEYLA